MSNRDETIKHIDNVYSKIHKIIGQLYLRGIDHDKSKLEEPEASAFEKTYEKLKGSTYGSKEYNQFLVELGPALQHHYMNNRHHPEHFKKFICTCCFESSRKEQEKCPSCENTEFVIKPDIDQMNLVDIVEMFCDWLAATERHADGDIFASIDLAVERFGLSEQLKEIFKNTAKDIFHK